MDLGVFAASLASGSDPEANGDFDKTLSSYGSDEELVKVGELELRDPFHSIRNEDGVRISVRKITKVTTLRRQSSRSRSLTDPDETDDGQGGNDNPAFDWSDQDTTVLYNSHTSDVITGDNNPEMAPGRQDRFNTERDIEKVIGSDFWSTKESDAVTQEASERVIHVSRQVSRQVSEQTSPEVSQQASEQTSPAVSQQASEQTSPEVSHQVLGHKSGEMTWQMSVERSRQVSHERMSSEVSHQMSLEGSYEVSDERSKQVSQQSHSQVKEPSLPSNPGSLKRRLSSINNPDYFNYVWRPILEKDKNADDEEDDQVYWRAVQEMPKEKLRTDYREDSTLYNTENYKGHQQTYNAEQARQIELSSSYEPSMVREQRQMRPADGGLYAPSGGSTPENESRDGEGFGERCASLAVRAERDVEDGFHRASSTRGARTDTAIVNSRLYERSRSAEQQTRETAGGGRSSSADGIQDTSGTLDQRFHERADTTGRQTTETRYATEELSVLVNTDYRYDSSFGSRSPQRDPDGRHSPLLRMDVMERRENIQRLEQSVNVRSEVKRSLSSTSTDSSSAPRGPHNQAPRTDITWRDPDLPEVIEYLGHHDNTVTRNAAAYLQHLSYRNEDIKKQIRELGGIPLLLELLTRNEGEIHQVACGALRNLSHTCTDDGIKRVITNSGGIPILVRLLQKTRDVQLQETITAILWNLSAVPDLKRPLLEHSLSVLVNKILIPHSGWQFDVRLSDQRPKQVVYCSVLLINTTGVLRNASSEGHYARCKMRECEGFPESLISIIQSALGRDEINNKCTENCTCILRNISYSCQEAVDQDCRKKQADKDNTKDKKEEKTGCFSTKKKASKTNEQPTKQQKNSPTLSLSADHRVALLWSSHVVRMYVSLLNESSNPVTIESAAGAIQNLCSSQWQPADAVRECVRKETGLPTLVELLAFSSDEVVRSSASALSNLAINEHNRQLLVRHAIPQLLLCLSQEGDRRPRDRTLCALLALVYRLIEDNADATKVFTEKGGTARLMHIVRSTEMQYQPRVSASVILTRMWKYTSLHDLYKQRGWSERDFLVKPRHPQDEKAKSGKGKKSKSSKKSTEKLSKNTKRKGKSTNPDTHNETGPSASHLNHSSISQPHGNITIAADAAIQNQYSGYNGSASVITESERYRDSAYSRETDNYREGDGVRYRNSEFGTKTLDYQQRENIHDPGTGIQMETFKSWRQDPPQDGILDPIQDNMDDPFYQRIPDQMPERTLDPTQRSPSDPVYSAPNKPLKVVRLNTSVDNPNKEANSWV